MKRLLVAGALLLLLAAGLLGQADRGVISGSVTDGTGAVIPGATIRAIRTETNTTAQTSTTESGDFTIPSLQAGTYRVEVEAEGFKQFVVTDIKLVAGGSARVTALLEIGSLSESVEVISSAVQLDTTSAKVISSVSTKMIDELPLVVGGRMRSPFDLALVTPEANQYNGGDQDRDFQIGGSVGGTYGATMDGVSILTGRFNSVEWASVNTPSVDAIQEFTVESNGFKAEYGRASGGIMTFTTKSGTNELHGTAYEFLRNSALDSRRFFEAQKATLKQHDFGWSLGGPVYIPKVYDGRNKTFFFAAQEWFRDRVGAASQRFSVPTPEMYNGDFTQWVDQNDVLIPIYDPSTTRRSADGSGFVRDPFVGNVIPQSRFSSVASGIKEQAQPVLAPNNAGPVGTSAYVRNNYINNVGTALNPWNKISIKVDHHFTDNFRVNYLYNWGLHDGPSPGPDGFPGLPAPLNGNRRGRQRSPLQRFGATWVVTPTIVNSFYGGLQKWKERNASENVGGDWKAKGVCIPNAFDCNENFPIITFDDFENWGASAGDGSENPVWSFGDDITITRGKHTFKAGYLYELMHYNGFGRQSLMGQADFRRLSTSIPGNNNLAVGGGSSFASFLLGEAWGGGTENDRFVGQQWRSHGMYVQDDFKVNRKLTLNFGVRYEFTLPPIEVKDRWSDWTPDRPNPGATRPDGTPLLGALRFAGFLPGEEGKRALVNGSYGGVAPRFGMAYQLDPKTVVRVGAGVSNGVVKTVTGSTHFEGAIIIFRPATTDNGVTPAFNLDQGIPDYPVPPFIDPAFSNGNNTAFWDNEAVRLPETYQWTLSIQRQLGQSWVFETSYNATVGAQLVAGLKNINQVPWQMVDQLGNSLLGARLDSAQARAAGIQVPYQEIFDDFGPNVSVSQALRPYPQVRDIQTFQGHGDKSGHSSYHSWIAKINKQFGNGVSVQSSYVLSKLISDVDSYGEATTAQDQYNRSLEKSISDLDHTHNFKVSYIWELPIGKGRRFLSQGGPLAAVLGGWRLTGTQFYNSGNPIRLVNANTFNTFAGRMNSLYMDQVGTYDGWVVNHDNPNWLGDDRYFVPSSFFGEQSATALGRTRPGDETRYNPKARSPWSMVENYSLAKSFQLTEGVRLDLRWEAFNAFNRSVFQTGDQNITSPNFGRVQGTANQPRRMQLGLKLYW